MYAKEAELVNTEFVARRDTYNLKLGGHGGFDHIHNSKDPKIVWIYSKNKIKKIDLINNLSNQMGFSHNLSKKIINDLT